MNVTECLVIQTVCSRSHDPLSLVSRYIRRVKTFWTDSVDYIKRDKTSWTDRQIIL